MIEPARPNPHEPEITGAAVSGVDSENTYCPFSGRDVATNSLVEVQGRVIGFCNTFCRDKVAADPMCWPEVAAMLR